MEEKNKEYDEYVKIGTSAELLQKDGIPVDFIPYILSAFSMLTCETQQIPNIVCIGNQKHGKTTLVQALTNLDLEMFIEHGNSTCFPSLHHSSFANVNLIDTPPQNGLGKYGKSSTIFLITDVWEFMTEDLPRLLSNIFLHTKKFQKVIVLVNKIDKLMSQCITNSEKNRKGFKERMTHEQKDAALIVIENPLIKMLQLQTLIKKEEEKMKQFGDIRFIPCMFSASPCDMQMMQQVCQNLSTDEKTEFWNQIWDTIDVMEYIQKFYK